MKKKKIHPRRRQHLLDTVPAGLFQLNKHLQITAINRMAEDMLGLVPGEHNKADFAAIPVTYLSAVGTVIPSEEHPAALSLATGEEYRDIMIGLAKPGGMIQWISASTTLLYAGRERKPKGVLCSLTDVTSTKKLEKKYGAIIETAPDGIVIIDQQGIIQLVNRQVEIIFGYDRYELLGNAVEKLMPARFKELHRQLRVNYTNIPHPRSMGEGKELYARKRGGEEFPVEISLSPIPVENDLLIAASIRDITKRKENEEKSIEIERKYHRAINSLGDNVWEHDFVNGTTWFSETVTDLTGFSMQEITDKARFWWNRVHPDDLWILEKNNDWYNAGLITRHTDEYRIYHKDGSVRWVLDRGKVYETDVKNRPLKITGTHKDITDRIMLQNKLEQERADKEREILKATVAGQEKEKNKIGMELHDNINQILVTVKMYLEIAKADKKRTEEMLGKGQNHLDKVIQEIRKLSHSLVSPVLDDINLHDSLKAMIEEISSGNKFTIVYSNNGDAYFTDKEKELLLFRIVQEQLSNIIKYAKAENIHITVNVKNDLIRLVITDDGVGFDVRQTTKGIGLRNILNRVNIYSGKMSLISAPGEGCRLEVEIPQ